jgi:hypothetical protein
MTMKTIKEWLETLPEPYRSKALSQANDRALKGECGTLAEAISGSISWRGSFEGVEYWIDVHRRAESGEFDKKDCGTLQDAFEGALLKRIQDSLEQWKRKEVEQILEALKLPPKFCEQIERERLEKDAKRRKQLEDDIVQLHESRNTLINHGKYAEARQLKDVERELRDELSRLS